MSGRIVQAGDIPVRAHFTASGLGATGLTVTIDVHRLRSGSYSEIVSAGSATEIGDGGYGYTIDSASVAAGDEFFYVFKTSGTADQQQLAGEIRVEANYTTTISGRIDAAVSSRSSHSAADVWSVGTRTLTSFGTLVADIWSYATRLLTAGTNIVLAKGTGVTGFNDLSASDVRTAIGMASADLDTQLDAIVTSLTAASVTVTSPVTTDGNISIIKGDDYQHTDGRALSFDYSSAPSLTAATPVRLYIIDNRLTTNYFDMTVVDADTLRLELTAAQTSTLYAGVFDYYIRATLSNGDVVTLTQSTITVDDVTT